MNSIVRMPSLFNTFDTLSNFDKIFGNAENTVWGSNFSHMTQISENIADGKYVVSFEVPGFDESQLNLRNENNTLHVSGVIEDSGGSGKMIKQVNLSTRLPTYINTESAKAELSKGILSVSFETIESESSNIEIKSIGSNKTINALTPSEKDDTG